MYNKQYIQDTLLRVDPEDHSVPRVDLEHHHDLFLPCQNAIDLVRCPLPPKVRSVAKLEPQLSADSCS